MAKDSSIGLVLGALMAGIGIVLLVKRGTAPNPPPNNPPGNPPPGNNSPAPGNVMPDLPAPTYVPPKPLSGSGFGDQPQKPPFDHIVVLYTSRWAGDHWGAWDGPTSYDGRLVTPADLFHSAVWVNPEQESVEYLEALAVTNSTPGYWAAYRVPLIEDANGTHYGAPGPWSGGHFAGPIVNSDGSHVTLFLGPLGSLSEVSAHAWG